MDRMALNSVDWLVRLIGFDTTSVHSNLALIHHVQDYCQTLGLSPILTFDETSTKANLFVTIATSDGQQNGGIVLSGHTDVVPVAGQAWTHEPFSATVTKDRVYGRGACDMKGFIACCLAALPNIINHAKQGKLTKPIHLALSFDEEVGCLGAPILLADLAKRGITPEYCVVGEPTNMQMVVAHKGISTYSCRVHGKSAHSSLTPQGVNAISYAARMIGFIDEFAQGLQSEQVQGFDVPFSTLSVGTIQGGTATNIIPNFCEFRFDYRNLPTMHTERLVPIFEYAQILTKQMQVIDKASFIEIIQHSDVPAMNDADNQALQTLIASLLPKSAHATQKVAYATEGGQFTQADIPTVICGPGSIEQAHKADEFVTISQLKQCDAFLAKLIGYA